MPATVIRCPRAVPFPDDHERRGGQPARPRPPRRRGAPGTRLELLVLCHDRDHLAAVDLASGALVRAWAPARIDPRLRPYDVVQATLGRNDDEIPDPTEPEAVSLAAGPEPAGRLRGRRVRRYLRTLLHPAGQPLLGSYGPAVAFWERTADHPSIAVVEPERPAVVVMRAQGALCWFRWRGRAMPLPCLDGRLSADMAAKGLARLETRRGERLVVALTPPVAGHCHKVVAGVLPRP